MKTTAYLIIKNEEKFIESNIRYNSHFFDKILVIDNGCTDQTMDIVWKLKDEGYALEVYNESYRDFEKGYFENKYLKICAKKEMADWIVPLDADEFIDFQEKLSWKDLDTNKNYIVEWKNYILLETDDLNEVCIPKRMQHCLVAKPEEKENAKTSTKVIVSGKLVREKNVKMVSGHHRFIGIEDTSVCYENRMYIAHFPIISREQLMTKIIGRYIDYIPKISRGTMGGHVNRHIVELMDSSLDLSYLEHGGYVLFEKIKYYNEVYCPLCPDIVDQIQMKYTNAGSINTTYFFAKMAEMLALKYCLTKTKETEKNVPKVLVYGTGSSAEHLLDFFEPDCVEILAYIDSDIEKQYYKFRHRVIVSPDKIKFFEFDKIIIASVYFDEIKEILLSCHIPENKICDKNYLAEISIR